MAGFLYRVMCYLANDLLVNSLANSRTFQRFAVRTSKKIENVTNIAETAKQKLAEQKEEIWRIIEEQSSRK